MSDSVEIDKSTTIRVYGAGHIDIGDKVDFLVTSTYTNTIYRDKKDWGRRQVSISLDVETAKKLIELLQGYVKYKEDKE